MGCEELQYILLILSAKYSKFAIYLFQGAFVEELAVVEKQIADIFATFLDSHNLPTKSVVYENL